MIEKPWITGPKELLVHGLQHLDLNSDFDNRIAMISIGLEIGVGPSQHTEFMEY